MKRLTKKEIVIFVISMNETSNNFKKNIQEVKKIGSVKKLKRRIYGRSLFYI